ncbi:amidohydrolase [Sphaerochaeta sp.]|uniref:amidohydrolase family protein n=1 Tax=Sphaerochaeta sp. TaxID=1972642 RepID=UPI002AA81C7D|nr:amidohydrolase [uncultured Sphaerochaeta sp.]
MKTLISNALVIPMTKEGYSLRTDIGIDGTHIAFVGKAEPSFHPDHIIDASSLLAMPALVNAHTHLSMGLMRNYKDDLPTLQEWLAEIFPIEDQLTERDILLASRLGIVESIQSGVTTIADMYFNQHSTAQAIIEGGIRASIGITLFGDLQQSKERVKKSEALLRSFRSHPESRIQFDYAPHAIYTCPKETYQYAHDLAKEHGALLHTHLSETRKEVEDSVQEFNATPLAYLKELGCLDDIRLLLAHCVHLCDEELEILKEVDATIVHNPSSNAKLSSGLAPVSKFLEHGLNVALGTDGASSNNNLNLFEEMHVASLIGRVYTPTNTKLSPYQVLGMATTNGAKALGLDHRIGRLEAGMEADILLVDLHKSHLTPLNDPFSALVYSAQASDVDTLFCQGRMLMQHRKVLSLSVEDVLHDANACWTDVLSRKRG